MPRALQFGAEFVVLRILAAAMGFCTAISPSVGDAATFSTLYSFDGGDAGAQPNSLITDRGVLYVATGANWPNNGVVMKLDIYRQRVKTLHVFAPNVKGVSPEGADPCWLIMANGILYDATFFGGPAFGGTVFTSDPNTGTLTTLYTFDGPTNGAYPGALIRLGGARYVTTVAGGASNAGTVFKIDLATGVALNGGGNQDGMLFSIDPASGLETTRYTF